MKNIPYADGSPSREWEDTGHDEMNQLYENTKNKGSKVRCLDILSNLSSLISVCSQSLINSCETKHVSVVLMIHVGECLEELEMELKKL